MTTRAGSTAKSEALYARAVNLIPAGVSSPVRAFRKVGGRPIYFSKGEGAYAIDEDGNRYVDFCMAWGPLILGHAHPAVVEAVMKTARDGLAFGTVHKNEPRLAELILEGFPYADRARFVVSGTEAVMTAVRLARADTGRSLLVKFAGCYHGHGDALLAKAGSGVVTQGLSGSEGVPPSAVKDTLVLPLGNLDALEQAFREHGKDIAAVITEPLPANNGLLKQSDAFLKALRAQTSKAGALLIFDEVINGFRFGYHGYAKLCGVEPDLTTLGKIIGGGMPVGAVLGKARVMEQLAPLGSVYQAGTMAGNPVALAAGIATLEELKKGEVYRHLEQLGRSLDAKLQTHALREKARLLRVGSVVWPYFNLDAAPPLEADDIRSAAVEQYHGSYRRWLERGVYLPPSAYEVSFLSAAHTEAHLTQFLDALA
ncbi:MAG: glutamate-1-semialdehyde 2,1-aminomutase [Archangiaceae bacterium]|nr:glutamate-1-semialdehyde 2,1-aminomutase [Archangiaceae bacterium]